MTHPNDIDNHLGEVVHIWVKPADGTTWRDVMKSSLGVPNTADWMPASLEGRCEEQYRGTGVDGRRIFLIGSQYSYDLAKFEFGDVI